MCPLEQSGHTYRVCAISFQVHWSFLGLWIHILNIQTNFCTDEMVIRGRDGMRCYWTAVMQRNTAPLSPCFLPTSCVLSDFCNHNAMMCLSSNSCFWNIWSQIWKYSSQIIRVLPPHENHTEGVPWWITISILAMKFFENPI